MNFKIGQVARQCNISRDTIRYYESLGLLTRVPRNATGYRIYNDAAVERIHIIRKALRFGFSLREVMAFLRARDNGKAPCHTVRSAAQRILEKVEWQIADLDAARISI